MTYKLNEGEICPSDFQWLPRETIGVSGEGRPIYPATRSVELRWEFSSFGEWAAAQVAFNANSFTGMSSITIPNFPTATGSVYAFKTYTGVFIHEPELGSPFFAGFPSDMVILVSNIPVE
jgi:hypothetical protein